MERTKSKKRIALTACAVVAMLLFAADLLIGNYLVSFAIMRAGYTFGEASALEQVKKSKTPMLFIHGSEDNFVHTEMVYRLYDACPAQKALYVAEGAGHGQSLFIDPEQYISCVFGFLDLLEK